MRIVVSGGGSGGHITPILAVTHHLISYGNTVYYIGSGSRQESLLFEGQGIRQFKIKTGKYRRYHGRKWKLSFFDMKTFLLNLLDLFKFMVGCVQSLWLLIKIRPDRVFVKGGYVGLPVGIAAKVLGIKLIIHESDSTPGLTNRILSRLTRYRLGGFEIPGFITVGNPVREEIVRLIKPDHHLFNIKSQKPVVLVFGGSLGSQQMNKVVEEFINKYDDFEVIHVTGSGNSNHNRPKQPYYHTYDFLTDEMTHALHLADVVVSRAGANTLAELAALGKPSIVVPHPNLSDDHQTKNANSWQDCIIILQQSQLNPESLYESIKQITDNETKRNQLQAAITKRSNVKAAADIAEYIINPKEAHANGS